MRLHANAIGFVVLLLSSCVIGGGPPAGSAGPVHLKVGETTGYTLFTHCGIRYAIINDTTFYADPPLSDGNGNPPPGWDNPQDNGYITLTSATTADFTDPSGHKAHFTSTPSGPVPTIELCD